ncbi:MAG: response regulator [Pseudobdellovibrionaceae bacterium]
MAPKKRINTRDLIEKIQTLARAKMSAQSVVSLDQVRNLNPKKEPDPKVILVIEDDETMRSAMKRIFESDGFKVIMAADGTQLSTVLDDSPLDLIILDIGLPWINGIELAQLMKQNSDLKKLPLIFVSGKTSSEEMKMAFDVGADDFIKKPFDVEKLKKTVRTLLKLAE